MTHVEALDNLWLFRSP